MVVTRLMVRKALVEYGLQHKTNAEIDAAMAQVDQEAMVAAEKVKFTVEVWDKVSPVNGVSPETIIEDHAIPEHGTAYMILDAGSVVYFQSRSPQSGEVITTANAEAVAEQHLAEFASLRATTLILEAVIDQLDV